MKKALLIRTSDDGNQTLGALTIVGDEFGCKTLELAWKENKRGESCIPKGSYVVKRTWSPSFGRYVYEIQDVPDRAGVRIHAANYKEQLRGCIALGSAHKDINKDGLGDLIHSGNTMKKFEELMNGEDFILTIV